jgi:hypothetical protein
MMLMNRLRKKMAGQPTMCRRFLTAGSNNTYPKTKWPTRELTLRLSAKCYKEFRARSSQQLDE